MTVQEYQDLLHVMYQGDTDTPSSNDDDWEIRLSLLGYGIRMWNSTKGILWNELWDVDTSETGNGVLTQFNCATDFRFGGGFVETVNSSGQKTYWKVIKPEKAEFTTGMFAYFTGNKSSGFKVNFSSAPTSGDTIRIPYYKEATIPTQAADVIEMSDPMFAVNITLSKLHELDGEGDRSSLAFALADGLLDGMKTLNIMSPFMQDNATPDRDYGTGVPGFGQ